MSYLEELLPEFRKGAKITKKEWDKKSYIYYKNGLIYDRNNQIMYNFSAKHFLMTDGNSTKSLSIGTISSKINAFAGFGTMSIV